MTHVVLSLPAIIIAAIVVGIPLNWILGGTRTALQRIAIAIICVPATIVLAVALFTFNALVPETYAALLRFADWIWQESLNALSAAGDTIPGARKLTNVARQGFSGHHFVIMALCSMIAAFLVNAFFAFATRPQETTPGAADSRTTWNSASKESELGRGGREAEPVNRNDSRDVTSTHPLRRPQGWHRLITLA